MKSDFPIVSCNVEFHVTLCVCLLIIIDLEQDSFFALSRLNLHWSSISIFWLIFDIFKCIFFHRIQIYLCKNEYTIVGVNRTKKLHEQHITRIENVELQKWFLYILSKISNPISNKNVINIFVYFYNITLFQRDNRDDTRKI